VPTGLAALTRDNVGSSLAIVMDDTVRAYARIQEEIPTGQVRITGFTEEGGGRTSRSSCEPRRCRLSSRSSNQQAVGASLGETAIAVGHPARSPSGSL
jgi:preprotein translocase subunit SecD